MNSFSNTALIAFVLAAPRAFAQASSVTFSEVAAVADSASGPFSTKAPDKRFVDLSLHSSEVPSFEAAAKPAQLPQAQDNSHATEDAPQGGPDTAPFANLIALCVVPFLLACGVPLVQRMRAKA